MKIAFSASLFAIAFLSGCAHTMKFGDAIYREPRGLQLGLVTSALSFPPVSLASNRETTIKVRVLRSSAYPPGVRIPTPPSENLKGRIDQPWRNSRFSIAITNATNNRGIYTQDFNLREYATSGSTRSQSASDKYIYPRLGEYGEDGLHSSDSWAPAFTKQTLSEQGASPQPSIFTAPSGG